LSLDAAVALDRERRSAHTDPLTGLYNRRGPEDLLDRELGGAQQDRTELSLVVLDLATTSRDVQRPGRARVR
jgi:GGDEF domain-containing protein